MTLERVGGDGSRRSFAGAQNDKEELYHSFVVMSPAKLRAARPFADRGPRPATDAKAPLAGAMDEIGDIPSFLRRERVDG